MSDNLVCDPRDIELKSTFLGPQSENRAWVRDIVNQLLENWFSWRRSLFPEDGSAISESDRLTPEFIARQAAFREQLLALQRRFETEIPKFSPRYVGHMFSEVSLPALLGHVLTLLHNPNNISGESSRVGIQVEDEAIAALAKMLGIDSVKAAGHFTSGGTVANFEALLRARARAACWLATGAQARERGAAKDLRPFHAALMGWEKQDELRAMSDSGNVSDWNFVESNPWQAAARLEKTFGAPFLGPVVLVPENKHYSWAKGVSMLGMGEDAHWPISLDRLGKLSIRSLRENLERAEREGRPVMLVVSVAGTTELGHFDPIHEVQDLLDSWRKERGVHIWHHVDAAFGGFFGAMSDEQRRALGPLASQALGAISRVDSVTLDPHKLGYVPYASGAFITTERRNYDVKSFTAPYVRFECSRDRGPYTLEGSRSAAGATATWMIAQTVGLDGEGYGRILDRTVAARKSLESALLESGLPARIAPFAESNIVAFTLAREGERLSATNSRMARLCQELGPEGRGAFFVSMTHLKWKSYGSYLDAFTAGWNPILDTDELTLARLCLMNPFFNSVETRTHYESELIRTLLETNEIINPRGDTKMKTILAAEHFDLTPAIRSHAEEQFDKIHELVPADSVVRVFLVRDCKHVFTVRVKILWRGSEKVARVTGSDLYVLIGQATTAMKRMIQKEKIRGIRKRRAAEIEPQSA